MEPRISQSTIQPATAEGDLEKLNLSVKMSISLILLSSRKYLLQNLLSLNFPVNQSFYVEQPISYMYGIHGGSVSARPCLYVLNYLHVWYTWWFSLSQSLPVRPKRRWAVNQLTKFFQSLKVKYHPYNSNHFIIIFQLCNKFSTVY